MPFPLSNTPPGHAPAGLPVKWTVLQTELARIASQFGQAVLASSLSAEDMVLTHAIYEAGLDIDIFTIDTGMLPKETLALLAGIGQRYGRSPAVYRPEAQAVEQYVRAHGRHAFYDSVALRKACCRIRKVEPLERALAGRPAWLTGQRRDQAVTRGILPKQEFDAVWNLEKFNPLADWTADELWQTIHALEIAYNPLHDQGYPSIGCDPCTRAIRPGEDIRAGRWWWESSSSKECGLHEINIKHVTKTDAGRASTDSAARNHTDNSAAPPRKA